MKKTNYFQDFLFQINKKITNKEYNQALKMINEELCLSYIPSDFEKQLLKIKDKLINDNLNLNSDFKPLNISSEFIISKLTNNASLSDDLEWIFLLESVNARNYLEEIKIFLKNPKQNPFAKTVILEILKAQEISLDFQVCKINQNYKINPYKQKSCITLNYFLNVQNKLLKFCDNNPNLLEVSNEIWKWYNYLIFPALPKNYLNDNIWALTIIYYVLKLQKQDLDIIKFCNNYQVNHQEILNLLNELKMLKE